MTATEIETINKLTSRLRSIESKLELLLGAGKLRQKFWTAEQAMEFLSMSRNTLYKHAHKLGGHKVGRQWRFKPELVEQFHEGGAK